MDSGRFDRLATAVAGYASRRSILSGLAAGGAGSLLGLIGGSVFEDANAKKKKKKKHKKDKKGCKKKGCTQPENPCQQAVCRGQKCRTEDKPDGTECGDGLECAAGECVCPNGVCVSRVSPANLGPWQFWNDQADPEQPIAPTFSTGPEEPPLGDGSAHLQIAGNPEGKLLSARIFAGTPLADFETLEYSMFVTSATSGTGPSLQLGVDRDPEDTTTGWQGRLVYVPSAVENVDTGEWITVDALADNGTGNWYFTRSAQSFDNKCPLSDPCNFSEILAQFPNIRIHPDTSGTAVGNGFIGFKVGSGEGAVDANVDALRIKIQGDETTTVFNFEPEP